MSSIEHFTTSRGTLETKLFLPQNEEDHSTKCLAVLLHPWSPLGGNMFDPLSDFNGPYSTASLKPRFVRVLSSLNFTGISEGQDLRELVGGIITKLGGDIGHLVIAGYSHGSLIATLHPIMPPPIKTSHILLSYPLSVRGLITFFRGDTFETALQNLVQDHRSNVLILYGDKDQFTSVQRYEQWGEQLEKSTGGQLSAVKIHGADHFWTGTTDDEMRTAVSHWLVDESQ